MVHIYKNSDTSSQKCSDTTLPRSGDEEIDDQIDVEAVEENAHSITCR